MTPAVGKFQPTFVIISPIKPPKAIQIIKYHAPIIEAVGNGRFSRLIATQIYV